MRKSKLLLAAMLFMVAGFYSCTKEGTTGATGATGTANVMYSNWAALRMTYNSTYTEYDQTIQADSITQGILDSGLVLSYLKIESGGQSLVVNAGIYMQEILSVGAIDLYSSVDFTGSYYRYIIIPAGVNISGRVASSSNTIRGYTKEEWKAMSYEQVEALLDKK